MGAGPAFERVDFELRPDPWDVPVPRVGPHVDLVSKYRGTLVGGGIGDALGRPAEAKNRDTVRVLYGEIRDFIPWDGYTDGPVGTVTDDTQMTMCVAETLIEHRRVDPDDLARRFVAWLPEGRGKGATCVAAVRCLEGGASWRESGQDSDGNGAAMRVAPVGLAHRSSPDRLRHDAALSAVVTHAAPMAVASSIVMAWAVAVLAGTEAGTLEPSAFMESVLACLVDVHEPGAYERKPAAAAPVRLADRLGELPAMLDREPDDAFDHLYNGAFVLESLPSAFWCFLRSPEDAEEVLVTAANGGRDADTVGAMAGALAGAYLGEEAFPSRWRDDLEFAAELRAMADGLLMLDVPPAGPVAGSSRGGRPGR